eukprot:13052658-Alexandrium_andersonii.AAC.1
MKRVEALCVWPLARANSKGVRGLRADCGRIADWSLRVGDFATSDALEARFRGQIRNLRGQRRRMH